MSFLGKLAVKETTFTIEDCTVAIGQNSDNNGRPSSRSAAEKFTVTLVCQKEANLFAEWAVASTMVKIGNIQFFNNDAMSVMQTIKFDGAYYLNYIQNYHNKNNKAMTIQAVISAKNIKIDTAKHENNWPTKS